MTKTFTIAAISAALLVTGSIAQADEYLETTGARGAGLQSYRNVYLQAPAQAAARRAPQYRVAPAAVNRAQEENWFDRAEGQIGQGG